MYLNVKSKALNTECKGLCSLHSTSGDSRPDGHQASCQNGVFNNFSSGLTLVGHCSLQHLNAVQVNTTHKHIPLLIHSYTLRHTELSIAPSTPSNGLDLLSIPTKDLDSSACEVSDENFAARRSDANVVGSLEEPGACER